eukprot:5680346-Amphidinium_carterae.2
MFVQTAVDCCVLGPLLSQPATRLELYSATALIARASCCASSSLFAALLPASRLARLLPLAFVALLPASRLASVFRASDCIASSWCHLP